VTTKANPESCGSRKVTIIDADAVEPLSVAIARTNAGRVGIVYDSVIGEHRVEMHLATFDPKTPAFTPTILKHSPASKSLFGQGAKITTVAPDTFAILAHDVDDPSGDVVLMTQSGSGGLSTAEAIVPAVPSPSELGVVADASGTMYATIRVRGSGDTATLVARRKAPNGNVEQLPDVALGLMPDIAPGVGGASLAVDDAQTLNLLFQYNSNAAPQHSMPRYHTFASKEWSYRKTIDNNDPDGLCGYSPRLALFGTRKYAAYFFRKAAQQPPSPTAELRFASWVDADELPAPQILEKSIPSTDPMLPSYRVAMQVDVWGLVHMAIVLPSADDAGILEYMRQYKTADGTTKWLTDIVDPDVLAPNTSAEVDLVLDEHGRPHIAYLSGKDQKIHYATRYDR
jgi:hypothetical protein